MRAVGVTEFGGPGDLHLVDVPAEPLGPGQVRLRVRAATVNPTDTYLRNGTYADRDPVKEFPFVPGMDVAGELAEIGADVRTDLAVGEHVMGIVLPSGAHGGYREDLVLPARSVARAPAGVDDVTASTLPMYGLSARLALDLMGLQPGQVLAVTGAAGAFGGYVVQLGRADGLADGAVQDALVLPAVRDGGAVATVRGYRGTGERGLRVHPTLVRRVAEDRAALDRLRQQAEDGVLTLRVADVLPAEQAAEAHRRLERGGVRGRLVLAF